jgi:putative membrane protein
MNLEALLAYLHLAVILALVVFISSEAALCRKEWMNAAVVRRLARLDLIYLGMLGLVTVSGLARIVWGMKGSEWYWAQPLMHIKLTVLVIIVGLSIQPSLAFRRWLKRLDSTGTLPADADIAAVRKRVMLNSHLLVLLPLAGVLLARGIFTR